MLEKSFFSSIFIWLFIFEESYPIYADIVTNPTIACLNEAVVVSCTYTTSSPLAISSTYTSFIVGTSDTAISESVVDGTGSHGGVDLAKLTASAPPTSSTSAQATITLSSYTSSDNGIRLGCSNTLDNDDDDDGLASYYVQSVNIQGANPPSPPTSLTATFDSPTCYGTVALSWTPGASEKPIERYILYENGVQINVITPASSYSYTKTLRNNIGYTYSIAAESCAGRSDKSYSNVISLGDRPSPPTSFRATFNSLTCYGTVALSWTPGASDRAIERYFLYENGVQIVTITPASSYSYTKTLQNNIDYTYSITAESCVGRSTATSSNTISVGDPPSPPTSFRAAFNSPTCSGTLVLSWTPGASDRAIEIYILYENGGQIDVITPTNTYSYTRTLQNNIDYTYSIAAESCVGRSDKSYSNVISVGDPPSPATNFTAAILSLDSDSCFGAVFLSWTPGESDRTIELYALMLNGAEIVSVTTENHFYVKELRLDVDYRYSLVAVSCAGNSTVTDSNVLSVEGYVLAPIPNVILSYNQSNSSLTISWSILPDTPTTQPLLIDYSIDIFYKYTQSGDVQRHTDPVPLSVLSDNTNYTRTLTPHSYETDYGVETGIRVCIHITQQCYQAFSGTTQCGEYSIVNPTEPKLSTKPTSAGSYLPVLIGSSSVIGVLSIFPIVLLTSIITTVYCRFVKNSKDKTPNTTIISSQPYEIMSLPESEVTTSPPTELGHTKYPTYTPMAALSHKQLLSKPSAYANMSD